MLTLQFSRELAQQQFLAVARLVVSAAGIFVLEDPSKVDLPRFLVTEAVLLTYPYLRSYAGQMWRVTGLAIHAPQFVFRPIEG